MKTYYKLRIPEPCHENWATMTLNEKGRFCKSCSKTVVDFTTMQTSEIHDYINENKHLRICGHIKQTQLNTINLQISETVFQKQLSFQKLFLLVMLITMGTTLFNCTDKNGSVKKIESIEIVQQAENGLIKEQQKLSDTLKTCTNTPDSLKTSIPKAPQFEDPQIMGEIIEVVGLVIPEEVEPPFSYHFVETPPKFKNTPRGLSKDESREHFQNKIHEIVLRNFDTVAIKKVGVKGTQRVYVQFEIDTNGKVSNIKTRASHAKINAEAKRVINLFPQFIPAKHKGKKVAVNYNLPIRFKIED